MGDDAYGMVPAIKVSSKRPTTMDNPTLIFERPGSQKLELPFFRAEEPPKEVLLNSLGQPPGGPKPPDPSPHPFSSVKNRVSVRVECGKSLEVEASAIDGIGKKSAMGEKDIKSVPTLATAVAGPRELRWTLCGLDKKKQLVHKVEDKLNALGYYCQDLEGLGVATMFSVPNKLSNSLKTTSKAHNHLSLKQMGVGTTVSVTLASRPFFKRITDWEDEFADGHNMRSEWWVDTGQRFQLREHPIHCIIRLLSLPVPVLVTDFFLLHKDTGRQASFILFKEFEGMEEVVEFFLLMLESTEVILDFRWVTFLGDLAQKWTQRLLIVNIGIKGHFGATDIALVGPGFSDIISEVLTCRAIFQKMKNYIIYAFSITIHIVIAQLVTLAKAIYVSGVLTHAKGIGWECAGVISGCKNFKVFGGLNLVNSSLVKKLQGRTHIIGKAGDDVYDASPLEKAYTKIVEAVAILVARGVSNFAQLVGCYTVSCCICQLGFWQTSTGLIHWLGRVSFGKYLGTF